MTGFPDPSTLEQKRQAALAGRWTLYAVGAVAALSLAANASLWMGIAVLTTFNGHPWASAVVMAAMVGSTLSWIALSQVYTRGCRPGRLAAEAACRSMGLETGTAAPFMALLMVVVVFSMEMRLVTGMLAVALAWLWTRIAEYDLPRRAVLGAGSVGVASAVHWTANVQMELALGVLALAFILPIAVFLVAEPLKDRLRGGSHAWLMPLGHLLPFVDRMELRLDAGDAAEVLPMLQRALQRGAYWGTPVRILLCMDRALEQLEDPRRIPVLCAAARHLPISAPLYLRLAEVAPDPQVALDYAVFAEANALRSNVDPAPYVAVRERLLAALEEPPQPVQRKPVH